MSRIAHCSCGSLRAEVTGVVGTGVSPFARIGMPAIGWTDRTASRIDSSARLRRVRQRPGNERYELLIAVIEHQSWREIGRRLGVRDVTARGRAIEALERLAER